MALFCIPRKYINVLQSSALKSDLDIAELYKMDSRKRREFFTKYTDKEVGKFLNTKFEQAMVSKQESAITDWVKSAFDKTAQKGKVYQNVIEKVKLIKDSGFLNERAEDSLLEDIITEKLGVYITADEMQNITEKATKVEEAKTALGNNAGNPAFEKESMAYYAALKEVNDYMLSLAPSGVLGILTGTIGRGNMLFGLKSAVINTGSNVLFGVSEAIVRRLSDRTYKATDNKLALSYINSTLKIYEKTGFDLSRMVIDKAGNVDIGTAASKVLGQGIHSEGPRARDKLQELVDKPSIGSALGLAGGMVRASGRFYEDWIFKGLMGWPDVLFSAAHFADSVNMNALKVAKGDKELARTYMEDALRVDPQTNEGIALRMQAVFDAEYATNTNDTEAGKIALGTRKLLNDVTGDLRAGDYYMPFVKTPANVLSNSMDYSGVGALRVVSQWVDMFKDGTLAENKRVTQNMARNLWRSGLGITAMVIFVSMLDEDDYRGIYEGAKSQLENARNSVVNAFRVGDVWISTDWLGPLGVPFNALMYAKKYGKAGPAEQSWQFSVGVVSNVATLPGIEGILAYGQSQVAKKDLSLADASAALGDWLVTEASARMVPSFIGDLAKGVDEYERKTSNPVEALQAKIPVIRNLLPVKYTIFGEEKKADNLLVNFGLSTVFGARVKLDNDNSLLKELRRVGEENDAPIKFTDWERSNSKKLGKFRERIGRERYKEATIDYGKQLKSDLVSLIRSADYRKESVEEKLKLLNNVDAQVQEKIFKKYGFKYEPEKKKK